MLGDGRDDDDRTYSNISLDDKLFIGGAVIPENNKWYIELKNDFARDYS